jgi:hypothetical protein
MDKPIEAITQSNIQPCYPFTAQRGLLGFPALRHSFIFNTRHSQPSRLIRHGCWLQGLKNQAIHNAESENPSGATILHTYLPPLGSLTIVTPPNCLCATNVSNTKALVR